MTDPRQAAARCLAAVVGGASLSKELPLAERGLALQHRPLYRELCYGTLRRYWRLNGALAPLFKKPLKNKDNDVRMLVYLGAYQLFYTRVPSHAVINTTVEAAKALGKPWAAGLINALLRRCQRDGEALFAHLDDASLSAMPSWLHRDLSRAWPDHLEQIIDANGSYPPMCLRVNPRQHSREQYRQRLAEIELDATPCAFAEHGLRMSQPCAVELLPGFAEGAASVQDEAAQLCCALLDLAPGQRVLDACAAPGGKSGAILESQPELEELVALDVDAQRLTRVSDNLQRLGLTATLVAADAAQTDTWWDGRGFDRILLDAPCSATGVLRRNPDILIHRKAKDISALSNLQLDLLEAMWKCLKPGGQLLYATCSVLPEENSDNVQRFLQRHPDAELLPIEATWGIPQAAGRQLLPSAEGADGFFYARLGRRKPISASE
ncbi:16S rRNA (cytosine(967)-C(5))-methyltransferase RsmB [Spongiibacter taiwanensis]|uniref:16S rRNA (cytosine(967)-C(5))-methyltransferase RsmB n=1 Tax=Spongiibacter taiwanensis TaxID=1748242 RepID=UPI00203503C5|nr:16S rRNA (cytosine(967)-C(5))-methyltransferase RsmB [Spongiibacter taiwanensis]USA41787.1 16S rRNA (cytosine(967)-C(5))-methyltransferase RsmB [Spongiibacter taiwanensis]